MDGSLIFTFDPKRSEEEDMADGTREMITGRVDCTLDGKGRAPLGRMSSTLGYRCVVSIEGQGCIACYSESDWSKRAERIIAEYGEDDPSVQEYLRLVHAFSHKDVGIDDTNRINLPTWIRENAGLKEGDKLVVVGRGTCLEIWSADVWNTKYQNLTPDSRKALMADALKAMGYKPPVAEGEKV